MDYHDLLKTSRCYSFFGGPQSGKTTKTYGLIVVSQLYNRVYIVHPHIGSFLVFDLQGNYLYTTKITIPGFIVGKICLISETVLCICDIRRINPTIIYLITNEGLVITKFIYRSTMPRNSWFVNIISSEKHNIFYIITSKAVHSLGKEGLFEIAAINRSSTFPTILGIRIIDENMNLLVCYNDSMYIYSTLENRFEFLIKLKYWLSNFEVFDGYVVCVCDARRLLVVSLDKKKAVLIECINRWPIIPRDSVSCCSIHVPSRKMYIGNKYNNMVSVYSLDKLIELYHKNDERGTVEDEEETPENCFELFN